MQETAQRNVSLTSARTGLSDVGAEKTNREPSKPGASHSDAATDFSQARRQPVHVFALSSFALSAETVALPVIRNTYPRAHKVARSN